MTALWPFLTDPGCSGEPWQIIRLTLGFRDCDSNAIFMNSAYLVTATRNEVVFYFQQNKSKIIYDLAMSLSLCFSFVPQPFYFSSGMNSRFGPRSARKDKFSTTNQWSLMPLLSQWGDSPSRHCIPQVSPRPP